MGIAIAGLGAAVPGNRVCNDSIADRVDTSAEWIVSRTGIRQRYHARSGTTTGALAVAAARGAIESSGGSLGIDLLLLATTTPDRPCPATAPKVAHHLGLGRISAADISAVCSGFLYALQLASGAISSGHSKRALVVEADVFSTILDPADRTTLPIFGDGAGAVILESGENSHILDIETFSNGGFEDLITIRGGGVEARLDDTIVGDGDQYFRMDGRSVFLKAIESMNQSMNRLLDRNRMGPGEIDFLVAHQANLRILRTLGDQLGLRRSR